MSISFKYLVLLDVMRGIAYEIILTLPYFKMLNKDNKVQNLEQS